MITERLAKLLADIHDLKQTLMHMPTPTMTQKEASEIYLLIRDIQTTAEWLRLETLVIAKANSLRLIEKE